MEASSSSEVVEVAQFLRRALFDHIERVHGGAMATESVLVTWTMESNADGKWALFMRVGGAHTQVSSLFDSREQLIAATQRLFQSHLMQQL
jgi:hypothetical protein